MRKLKKALSLTLALALSLALALPAGAADEEYYQYITFTKEAISHTQMTTTSSQDSFVSFPVWIFPDDTEFTVTIPDGGSVVTEWMNCSADGSQWVAGAGFDVDMFVDDDDSVMRSETFDVGDGLSRWVICSSAEYNDEGVYVAPAGEVIEEIYFCTQSSFDIMIAGGAAAVEQPAEPTEPAEPEQPVVDNEPPAPSNPAAPEGISVTVGGTAVVWTDVAPFIDANSRTMVPLRAVADAMELTVSWDGDARVASFSDGDKTISFPIDSSTAQTSDGAAVQMDTAAVIANERTYAPIRYLAEYFGYTVGWDGATQTVSLTK